MARLKRNKIIEDKISEQQIRLKMTPSLSGFMKLVKPALSFETASNLLMTARGDNSILQFEEVLIESLCLLGLMQASRSQSEFDLLLKRRSELLMKNRDRMDVSDRAKSHRKPFRVDG